MNESIPPHTAAASSSEDSETADWDGSSAAWVRDQLLLIISKHARQRAWQRRILAQEIELAASIGRRIEQDGATLFFLGRRELERHKFISRGQERLEGTTVVVSRDGAVITAYRNRAGVAGRLRRRGHRGFYFHRRNRKFR
jgi:hypothetical protein